jgi:hypothetical protein
MLEVLWDEVECMMDAWGWSPIECFKFIAENRDMYEGEIGDAYDRFAEVLTTVFNTEGATVH